MEACDDVCKTGNGISVVLEAEQSFFLIFAVSDVS